MRKWKLLSSSFICTDPQLFEKLIWDFYLLVFSIVKSGTPSCKIRCKYCLHLWWYQESRLSHYLMRRSWSWVGEREYIYPIFQSTFSQIPFPFPHFCLGFSVPMTQIPFFQWEKKIGESNLLLQSPHMSNLQDVTYTLNQDITLTGCSTVARILRIPSLLCCPPVL